jgi:hypothetical protein
LGNGQASPLAFGKEPLLGGIGLENSWVSVAGFKYDHALTITPGLSEAIVVKRVIQHPVAVDEALLDSHEFFRRDAWICDFVDQNGVDFGIIEKRFQWDVVQNSSIMEFPIADFLTREE